MPDRCASCGAALEKDEIALSKKLINRGLTSFFCLSCLAKRFQVDKDALTRKIDEFREAGCTLFERE